jgi:hypothetical protein
VIDETDISQEKQWYHQERANTVIKRLQKKHINGFYAADRKAACAMVLDLVPAGAYVVRGDSMSVDQCGIIEALLERQQNRLMDAFYTGKDGTKLQAPGMNFFQMIQEAFRADVYITGSNAITLDGKIVNVDGLGNRVAPMIFGPQKVILVLGVNKIVANEEEARQRIRDFAAPLNVRRHYTKHHRENLADLACLRTGRCVDCESENRICRYTTIINGADRVQKGRINVVLIGEELGL